MDASTVVQGHWQRPNKVEASTQRPTPVGPAFRQPSADRFPAYASTTYGSRGEPNRPWVPSQSRLDLYA